MSLKVDSALVRVVLVCIDGCSVACDGLLARPRLGSSGHQLCGAIGETLREALSSPWCFLLNGSGIYRYEAIEKTMREALSSLVMLLVERVGAAVFLDHKKIGTTWKLREPNVMIKSRKPREPLSRFHCKRKS